MLHGHIIDIEEAVIGAILIEKDAFNEVADVISSKDFLKEKHELIFESIKELAEKNRSIDILTVSEYLRSKGKLEKVGGAYEVSKLTNTVASSAHLSEHARIIKQKSISRNLIKIGQQITADAEKDLVDIFDQIETAEKSIFSINNSTSNIEFEKVHEIAFSLLTKESKQSISSGFTTLDRPPIYGLDRGDLTIIAARPSMGKTAFALCSLLNTAKQGIPVAFYSLEMSKIQVVSRIMSILSGVDVSKIMRKNMTSNEFELVKLAYDNYESLPFYITDKPALKPIEIRSSARKLKRKYGIERISIDQLNHINHSSDGRTRDNEIGDITRGIKSLAKELDIPIDLLCQLSRAVETRGGDKRPQLSDLRDSGNIEQDADRVYMIYREDYYNKNRLDYEPNGIAEVIISKNRNGGIDKCLLDFKPNNTMFSDLTYDKVEQYREDKKSLF